MNATSIGYARVAKDESTPQATKGQDANCEGRRTEAIDARRKQEHPVAANFDLPARTRL